LVDKERLISARKERIQVIRKLLSDSAQEKIKLGQEPVISVKKVIAELCLETGIREVVALSYLRLFINSEQYLADDPDDPETLKPSPKPMSQSGVVN
jgi:hypothetical protein